MPSSARVYARLQSLLQRPTANLADIVDLVQVDAGLAAGVLRVGNSPCFNRGEHVESVHEAINRVGMREVNRIVGLTVAGHLFASKLPLYRLDGDTLSLNSLATALALGFLARAASEDERQGYTLGLLRAVGRVALQRLALAENGGPSVAPFEQEHDGHCLLRWEKATFGATHPEMSALLLAEWGFDASSCAAVRHHFQPAADPNRSRLTALLHVAGWTAEMLGKGLPGEKESWSLSEPVLRQAGLREEEAEACILDTRTELNRLNALVQTSSA